MELTTLLERASAHVSPSPDLLARTRDGGRSRLKRRRLTAVAVVIVLSVGVTGVPRLLRGPDTATVTFAGTIFDGAAHGDLATDTTYREQVLRAWADSHAASLNAARGIFDDLRGEARVVWAGTTPAGPAAVVTQDAYLHHHGNIQLDHEGTYQLLGFVGPGADGKPSVVADTYPAPGVSPDIAWYVDSARTVVAAIDAGKPLGISYGWIYGHDGSTTRQYTPMSQHDGVAWQQLPHGTVPGELVHVGLLPVTGPDDVRGVLNAVLDPQPADLRLPWIVPGQSGDARALFPLRGTWRPTVDELASRLDKAVALRRSPGEAFSEGFSLWFAYGVTPDGRQLVVGEDRLESDASHLYAVLGVGASEQVVSPGAVDPKAPLPVAVHLPDRQGWVVAQLGHVLEYRIGAGSWISAGHGGALLPDAATAVRVTGPGVSPTVVPLQG